VDARLVTWVRVQTRGSGQARVLWAGVNAVGVTQRARVLAEILPDGTGAPDQAVQLGRSPVLPSTVTLTVGQASSGTIWTEVPDLADGGPEVRISDPALPPGTTQPERGKDTVFALDAEAGRLTFGDGLHGRRPGPGDRMRVDYDFAVGQAGNVGAGVITGGPTLPPGFTAKNPVRTWGGADAESAQDGARQVSRYLQHRDRLVSSDDFATIALRAPGTDLARADVLAAYDPQLAPNIPGDAPGAVTLMVVPRRDPATPDSPSPDRFTLDAVCAYLEPRRLVTTELFLRGPEYVPLWVSVGIDVLGGLSIAEVRARVITELRQVLSPLPLDAQPEQRPGSVPPTYPHTGTGWPLRTAVSVAELSAYVTRVDGVHLVNGMLLAAGSASARDRVDLTGLQLPRIAGISVTPGDPAALDVVRGVTPTTGQPGTLPIPVFVEGC
jgi:predicted phage baseplate assembly protein